MSDQEQTLSRLRDLLSMYVTETVDEFPVFEGQLVVIHAETRECAQHINLDYYGDNPELALQKCVDDAVDAAKTKNSTLVRSSCAQKPNIICLHNPMFITGNAEYDVHAALDHEKGHLVVAHAIGEYKNAADENCKESAADVYCALTHIQRYGADTGFLDRLIWKRAVDFVLNGENERLTVFSLQELKGVVDNIDFAQMTPVKIAHLSWNIAAKSSINSRALDDLTFTAVRNAVKSDVPLEEQLKLLAQMTGGEYDYNTTRLGLAVLMPYIETGKRLNGQPIDLNGPDWDELRHKLKEKELSISAQDVLFNMPVKKSATTPKPAGNSPTL